MADRPSKRLRRQITESSVDNETEESSDDWQEDTIYVNQKTRWAAAFWLCEISALICAITPSMALDLHLSDGMGRNRLAGLECKSVGQEKPQQPHCVLATPMPGKSHFALSPILGTFSLCVPTPLLFLINESLARCVKQTTRITAYLLHSSRTPSTPKELYTTWILLCTTFFESDIGAKSF